MRVPIKSCGSQFERVEAALAESFADKVASFDRYRGYVWLADKPERLEHKVLERPKLVICYKVVVAGERKLPQMELVSPVYIPQYCLFSWHGPRHWVPRKVN